MGSVCYNVKMVSLRFLLFVEHICIFRNRDTDCASYENKKGAPVMTMFRHSIILPSTICTTFVDLYTFCVIKTVQGYSRDIII